MTKMRGTVHTKCINESETRRLYLILSEFERRERDKR